MNESYANCLLSFLEFFHKYLLFETDLAEINNKVVILIEKSREYEKFLKADKYSQYHTTKFASMREFCIYDMIYRIMYMLARDSTFRLKALTIHGNKEIRRWSTLKTADDQIMVNHKEAFPQRTMTKTEVQDYLKNLDIEMIIVLFRSFYDIVQYSFEQNQINQSYCSQFFKVPLECLLRLKQGIFCDVKGHFKQELKAIMIKFCQAGFTDSEKITHDQITNYIDAIFRGISHQ